ncbi:DUF5677 domain-containing protein [Leptospira interrogans]|uniref:DUF5677 domain-containing protein n=1 Tax=Leptospira interrogans TaxID=173 RepID=UPI001F20FBC5|nr:DUF5677 domain-containing protein [Leptospira interrogans]
MPEYLWLGLILMSFERKKGIEKAMEILSEISNSTNFLTQPRFSEILSLSTENQEIIYKIILKHVDARIIAPLTLLYRSAEYPTFNKYFYLSKLTFGNRFEVISHSIKIFSPAQSNEATDLRYLSICLQIFKKQVLVQDDSFIALKEYPSTDHDDQKMHMFRPIVRSMEGVGIAFAVSNEEFNRKFWRDIGMISECQTMHLKFTPNSDGYESFIDNSKKLLEYIVLTNKEDSLSDDRFDVFLGSVTYCLKIVNEIAEKMLGDCILARHGVRTILEIYIILKYLIRKENENPRIWEEYKLYGISKYKLILLKAREGNVDKESHFSPDIVDALVNEIKWEEFIDVDLKYFDKLGIREKSIEVGEKFMYDLIYDYDSNFSHGLWGAIRESSMLICDNHNHKFHSVPDFNFNQNLPDVKFDLLMIVKKVLFLLSENYPAPESYTHFIFHSK